MGGKRLGYIFCWWRTFVFLFLRPWVNIFFLGFKGGVIYYRLIICYSSIWFVIYIYIRYIRVIYGNKINRGGC